MDGRVQLPLIGYLTARFGVDYVDVVTEAGPNGILGHRHDPALIESILHRIRLSIERHNSVGIAVAGHFDCLGNPVSPREHAADTLAAVKYLQQRFPQLPVIGLWVNQRGELVEVSEQLIGMLPE